MGDLATERLSELDPLHAGGLADRMEMIRQALQKTRETYRAQLQKKVTA